MSEKKIRYGAKHYATLHLGFLETMEFISAGRIIHDKFDIKTIKYSAMEYAYFLLRDIEVEAYEKEMLKFVQ